MAKFRKKPVVIEAMQWTGGNVETLSRWAAAADFAARKRLGTVEQAVALPIDLVALGHGRYRLEIKTKEGVMTADEDDWIICGVAGEFYPCKPDIFSATYEAP